MQKWEGPYLRVPVPSKLSTHNSKIYIVWSSQTLFNGTGVLSGAVKRTSVQCRD